MAGTASDDSPGTGASSGGGGGGGAGGRPSVEGLSSGQRSQSSDALAEWRSSEQVENGTPSTSPPYWDTDDSDDDGGPKPSELYGKYTWKIEKFSQINKRELRSNAFEVGGYKWYILIYPQGCDVCNHLSLFLCVANHDKLLPGWSHFAQFTIAVVNKDPKKSKYSDTLHKFWKKEHDWGWKKFMELSKVSDGFVDADTLIIKAQVQVIREKAERPFRCLDCQYRRELVRVYLTNVEQICRRFVEERRGKLGKLIEDKARWSSFCAFWLGMDQNARRRMSREKKDNILKVVVKQFFVEKEVTSTLVMDSLYSGLKALEAQCKVKKGKGKLLEGEDPPAPVIQVEEDMFVLIDDVLVLLERAALEPLPPKDEKGPQNRTKDGGSGEDFNKDSIERDERRLTELGRRTVEIFVLAHIFSNKIEVAYQEAVALKRQEELIREEEAACLAEHEQKARRGVEKDKKSKKKQGKQKRNNRKGKDKGKDDKPVVSVQDKQLLKNLTEVGKELNESESALEKDDVLDDLSDVSDAAVDILHPDSEDRDASPVNWDTDNSEIQPSAEASGIEISSISSIQNGGTEKRSSSTMDDSSSTCSTDSAPSVVMNGSYGSNSFVNYKGQKSPTRVKVQRGKLAEEYNGDNEADHRPSGCAEADHRPSVRAEADHRPSVRTEADHRPSVRAEADHRPSVRAETDHRPSVRAEVVLPNASSASRKSFKTVEMEVTSLQDRTKWPELNAVKKHLDEVVLLQRKPSNKEPDVGPSKEKTLGVSPMVKSPPRTTTSGPVQLKSEVKSNSTADLVPAKKLVSNGQHQSDKGATLANAPLPVFVSRPDSTKASIPKPAEKPTGQHSAGMSRPLSAPLIPVTLPAAPVVSMVQAAASSAPPLSRSVSAAGRLGPEPSASAQAYIPQSYRNAIMGNSLSASSAGYSHSPQPASAAVSTSSAFCQQPGLVTPSMLIPQAPERMEPTCVSSGISLTRAHEVLGGQPWMDSSQRDVSRSLMFDSQSLLNNIPSYDLYRPMNSVTQELFHPELSAGTSGRPVQGTMTDEFPHLDIINDLLDDEQGIGRTARGSMIFQGRSNGPTMFNRQFTYPTDTNLSSEAGTSCRYDRSRSYQDDGFRPDYLSASHYDPSAREFVPQGNSMPYVNGQVDSLVPNQWQLLGPDLSSLGLGSSGMDGYPYSMSDFSNMACGVNGYSMFRPSSGH